MRQAIGSLRCTARRASMAGRPCRRTQTGPGCPGTRRPRRVRWLGAAAAPVALTVLTSACGSTTGPDAPGQSRVVNVVAAENFWGSIASQLGGSHVRVLSIVTDPNTDPHDYESSASAARAVAEAGYVIQNGVGYDDWMGKLLAASPSGSRRVFDIGAYLGKRPGDNPHLWYNPDYVTAAENHIEADLKALDPRDEAYFTARRKATDAAFAGIRAQLAQIRRTDRGKPVASTESIFVYLARYLGLKLVSPPAFMNAVSEGNDPPAASVAEFTQQLSAHRADVLVYNQQTATALTTSIRELAMSHHIPVVGVTETIQPPGTSFQRWFSAELAALSRALNRGTP
jgi:zinc/manganese transport system substrate-binding protein